MFLKHKVRLGIVNAYQALKLLKVDSSSSQEEIKSAYRKLALELHPDRKKVQKEEDEEFKKITEAYNYLKNNHNEVKHATKYSSAQNAASQNTRSRYRTKPQWGATEEEKIPEQDWSKYTQEFEEGDPDFWKEYEKKFWEEYNAKVRPDGKNGEFEKAKEPKEQPDLFVDVDKSLCIGCCSCEILAPEVFHIDKERQSNPKSSVKNPKGAGVNKIMNAAETCPTKAIIVEDNKTKERLYPY